MEREIIFCRIGKGTSKEGKSYYYIEYVKTSNYSIKRDYIEAIDYATLEKKTKGKELQKLTGILGVNPYDVLYVKDVR